MSEVHNFRINSERSVRIEILNYDPMDEPLFQTVANLIGDRAGDVNLFGELDEDGLMEVAREVQEGWNVDVRISFADGARGWMEDSK